MKLEQNPPFWARGLYLKLICSALGDLSHSVLAGKQNPRGYTAWDEMRLDEEVAEKVKERGKRKWTRELKGSYVDNEDLMEEVCSGIFLDIFCNAKCLVLSAQLCLMGTVVEL